jgi:FMN phosphatase YigB (HAD superfamily)
MKMTQLNEKVILTDCDGVLVDWLFGFKEFMANKGYTEQDPIGYAVWKRYGLLNKDKGREICEEFNNSAAIAYLTPNLDAVKYVRKLHEEGGYVLRVITSLSLNKYAYKARLQNLHDLFGESVIDELVCLDTGADKDEALEPYRGTDCVWVEDKVQNAVLGDELGLNSFLIDLPHNRHLEYPNRVNGWEDIYHSIVGV